MARMTPEAKLDKAVALRVEADELEGEVRSLRHKAAEIAADLVTDGYMRIVDIARAFDITDGGLAKQLRPIWEERGEPSRFREPPPVLDSELIRDEYRFGEPMSVLAKKYGTSFARIKSFVEDIPDEERLERPRQTRLVHAVDPAAVVKDYLDGTPVTRIAEHHRTTFKRIKKILAEEGYE